MLFRSMLHKCTDYRKTISALTFELENTKHDYDEVSKNNIAYQSELKDARIKIETRVRKRR